MVLNEKVQVKTRSRVFGNMFRMDDKQLIPLVKNNDRVDSPLPDNFEHGQQHGKSKNTIKGQTYIV